DVVAEAGGQHLCGVIYSAMQKYMAPATSAARAASAAALSRLGEHARGAGVELSLEIVNRYETNIVNTARAGLGFLAEIGSDNVHLHLDTYHMNIEESGMYRSEERRVGKRVDLGGRRNTKKKHNKNIT